MLVGLRVLRPATRAACSVVRQRIPWFGLEVELHPEALAPAAFTHWKVCEP